MTENAPLLLAAAGAAAFLWTFAPRRPKPPLMTRVIGRRRVGFVGLGALLAAAAPAAG